VKNLVEKKEKDKKDHIVQKNVVKNAKKTPSINKKIVPVINMFKMLPQAKYKIVTENNPPPPSIPSKEQSVTQIQKSNPLSKEEKTRT
jgi:hypothetical protein